MQIVVKVGILVDLIFNHPLSNIDVLINGEKANITEQELRELLLCNKITPNDDPPHDDPQKITFYLPSWTYPQHIVEQLPEPLQSFATEQFLKDYANGGGSLSQMQIYPDIRNMVLCAMPHRDITIVV